MRPGQRWCPICHGVAERTLRGNIGAHVLSTGAVCEGSGQPWHITIDTRTMHRGPRRD